VSDNRLPDDWVIVAEAGHGVEASMIEDRLRADGIEVVTLEARGAPGAWLTGAQPFWAPKSIAVPAADEDRALELLEDMPEAEEGDEQAEPGYGFEEEDDVDEPVAVEPFDPGGPAVMENLRRVAWVLSAAIVAGILWTQCPRFA
jgi:hypothetical protein